MNSHHPCETEKAAARGGPRGHDIDFITGESVHNTLLTLSQIVLHKKLIPSYLVSKISLVKGKLFTFQKG